jgi:hypothetical protein
MHDQPDMTKARGKKHSPNAASFTLGVIQQWKAA